MAYRIHGLDPAPFTPLFGRPADVLAERQARRVIADAHPGYPCRVTLQDVPAGEPVILVHHVSHDVATPYRSAYAIYVREGADAPAEFSDAVPPVFAGRTLALRAFDDQGMLRIARLVAPGMAEEAIHELLSDADTAYLHAHNAAYGCFAARVDRD